MRPRRADYGASSCCSCQFPAYLFAPGGNARAIQGAERIAGSAQLVSVFRRQLAGAASPAARDLSIVSGRTLPRRQAVTGVPAHFLVAHSALETGWGKSEIRRADGSPSYNLFGVKAGRSWRGQALKCRPPSTSMARPTGTRKVPRLCSYAEAFRDYATCLSNNPRFSGDHRPAGWHAVCSFSCNRPATRPIRCMPTSWRASSTARLCGRLWRPRGVAFLAP
jgi:hypothetical protein